MFFRQFLHDEGSCISYMIGCSSRGVVAVVDPQVDSAFYQETARKYELTISHIIETHVQADHRSGAKVLSAATGAPIFYYQTAPVQFPFKKLKDDDQLQVGNRHIRIIYTPGHTDESIILFVDDWFVLTGDTLFVGDVGRVDLTFEKNPAKVLEKAKKLHSSLFDKLLALPDHIEIYPGHYGGSACGKHLDGKPISTIGREKHHNYALQFRSLTTFLKMMTTNIPPPPANYRRIKRKNLGSSS